MKSEIPYFFIRIELLYIVVLVPAVQHRESAICIHMSPPSRCSPQPTPLTTPFRSSQSAWLSPLCYTAACHQLFYTEQCIYVSATSSVHPPLSFLPCKQVHLYSFSRFHIYCRSVAQSCLFVTPWAIFHIYAFIYDGIAIF